MCANTQAVCRDLVGAFAFAFMDAVRNYVFAARSSDGIAPLFWCALNANAALNVNT